MPFITEEIYHLLQQREDDLCIKQFSAPQEIDRTILEEGELLKKVISALRDARNKNQVKPKETIRLNIQTGNTTAYSGIENILSKQVNADTITFTNESISNAIVVAVEKDKFYLETEQKLDSAVLKEELLKDLSHQQKFLESVAKKLSNERFVANAKPEVVELEKKKQSDAEARIKVLQESLATL
jgi:valyl-tRNA synthetase